MSNLNQTLLEKNNLIEELLHQKHSLEEEKAAEEIKSEKLKASLDVF